MHPVDSSLGAAHLEIVGGLVPDRIVVDTARTVPAAGELSVLWNGAGLVVKRVEALTAQGRLRLASVHPDYPPYERPADEVHVIGKVLWKVAHQALADMGVDPGPQVVAPRAEPIAASTCFAKS